MKKKKIILLGLMLVLLVLLALIFKQGTDNKKLDPQTNRGWKFSDDIKDIFINKNNLAFLIKTSTSKCADDARASYYFNAKQAADLLNNNVDWSTAALVVVDIDDCFEIYKFSIREGSNWKIKTLKKNIFDFFNKSAFAKKKASYFDELRAYLESSGIEVCSDFIPGRSGFIFFEGEGVASCVNEQEMEADCKDGPKTLEIGREMYPIGDRYSSDCGVGNDFCDDSDNVLGELFTADGCGEERVKEIYGDSGNFHPFGLRIDLSNKPAQHDFLSTLKEVGFECSKVKRSNLGPNEDSCSEVILSKQVKIGDLLKLKEYYLLDYFSLNNVYLEHLDYGDRYLPTKPSQSLYVSDNLDLKFIYANPDPFFMENCVIKEAGNKIENSCGLSIEVVDKDRNASVRDTLLNLIPDINYCDIETIKSVTNFDFAYRIVPKKDAFAELNVLSDISVCGNYVSFGSNYYDIYYNEDFPDRLLFTNWGGHEPVGTLEKTDGPVSFWVHTVEFF